MITKFYSNSAFSKSRQDNRVFPSSLFQTKIPLLSSLTSTVSDKTNSLPDFNVTIAE